MFRYSFYACMAGLVLDLIFGDPVFPLHPIRLIGGLITKAEACLRAVFKGRAPVFAGCLLAFAVVFISTGLTYGLLYLAYGLNSLVGLAAESLVCFFMVSAKALKQESMKVYYALERGDTEAARSAVAMIVGRDTACLDKEGIAKAAVETVAENLSDGVIAPFLYMLIGGGVIGVAYKAVNTLDSMVGYKNDKYLYFGRASAKLDDLVNLVPARLSALIMLLSALIMGEDYKNALKIFKRDRYNHASPNSAQTEAVCAGALRVRLAGDAYYFGKLYKKPYIGDSLEPVGYDCIRRANRLMYCSVLVAAAGGLALGALVKFIQQGGIL